MTAARQLVGILASVILAPGIVWGQVGTATVVIPGVSVSTNVPVAAPVTVPSLPCRRSRATPHRRAPSCGGGNSIGNGAAARFVGTDSPGAGDAIEDTDDPGIAHEINRVGPRRVATEAQCHYLFRTHPFPHQRGRPSRWRGHAFVFLDNFACQSAKPMAEEESAAEWGGLSLVEQSAPLSRNAGNWNPPMDKKKILITRLKDIGHSLENAGHALALIGLGSVGIESERLDEYSDLDFFAIVEEGYKPRFIQNLDWLSSVYPVAYHFQNPRMVTRFCLPMACSASSRCLRRMNFVGYPLPAAELYGNSHRSRIPSVFPPARGFPPSGTRSGCLAKH